MSISTLLTLALTILDVTTTTSSYESLIEQGLRQRKQFDPQSILEHARSHSQFAYSEFVPSYYSFLP